MLPKTSIGIDRARKILGTASKKYSDLQIQEMINNIEALTDIVLDIYDDSRIKGGIAFPPEIAHTNK